MSRVLGLDHVSVTTGDLDRSLRFYRDLLGLALLDRGVDESATVARVAGLDRASIEWAELDLGGGQILELLFYRAPAGRRLQQRTCDPGSGHFSLRVDDLDAICSRLGEAGVTVRSQPVLLQEPPGWRGARLLYALDPDGFTVELVQRPHPR